MTDIEDYITLNTSAFDDRKILQSTLKKLGNFIATNTYHTDDEKKFIQIHYFFNELLAKIESKYYHEECGEWVEDGGFWLCAEMDLDEIFNTLAEQIESETW